MATPPRAALGNFGVNAALVTFTTFLDANEARPRFGEGKGANTRRLREPVHGGIDRRHRDRRTTAAVHLLVEMTEHNARRRQNARSSAHDFRHRYVNIAIGDDGA